MNILKISLFALLIIAAFACNKEDDVDQAQVDKDLILAHLTDNNITAEETEEGLYYVITSNGNSESMPNVTSTVEVKYRGTLLNGSVFDETVGNDTFTSSLGNLIEGWRIGIPLMTIGSTATLYIPSHLGYGDRATGSIPANSVLIFEIELIDFN